MVLMTLVPLAGAAVHGEGVGAAEWVAVAIFVGVYILIATERVHRVAAALGGAGLVLAFGIVDSQEAFYSQETGVDWDVMFLLLGMMLVVGVIRRHGRVRVPGDPFSEAGPGRAPRPVGPAGAGHSGGLGRCCWTT